MAGNNLMAKLLTVEVVRMGVEAAGVGEAGVEAEVAVLAVAGPSKLEPAWHHLHVALAQCIIHHILVLLHLSIRTYHPNVRKSCPVVWGQGDAVRT